MFVTEFRTLWVFNNAWHVFPNPLTTANICLVSSKFNSFCLLYLFFCCFVLLLLLLLLLSFLFLALATLPWFLLQMCHLFRLLYFHFSTSQASLQVFAIQELHSYIAESSSLGLLLSIWQIWQSVFHIFTLSFPVMECRISLEIWRDRVFITSNTSNMMAPVFLAFLQRNVWTWLEVQRAPLMTQLEICIHERGLPPPPGAAAWNKRDSSAAHKTSHNASRLIHLASQIFRWWLTCQILLFTKSDTFLELACIISERSRAINNGWIQNKAEF